MEFNCPQSRNGSLEEARTECLIYFSQLVLNGVVVYILTLVLVYWRWCVGVRESGRMFSHHVVIWSILLGLLILSTCELAEIVIVVMAGGTWSIELLTAASALLALLVAAVFYHYVERTEERRFLWILILFFGVSGLFGAGRLAFHSSVFHLTVFHVKVVVAAVSGIGHFGLAGLLIHTFFSSKPVSDFEDKDSVKYVHYSSPLISRISFYWFTSVLWLGYKHPLEEEDLGQVPYQETTAFQFARFNKSYLNEKEEKGSELSLWKCLFRTLGSSMVVSGIFRLAADSFDFVAPLGIKTIVDYVGQNDTEIFDRDLTVRELFSNGYFMAGVILLSALFQATFSQCSTFLVNSEGIHIKIALQALIYEKSLTLSQTKSSKNESSSQCGNSEEDNSPHGFDNGSITNIMSEDTNNIMMFFWMAHFCWAIPLKLMILMGLLYLQLGFSALTGAAICIIIMIPLQYYIGKKMTANSKQLMELCDERLRGISEILQGMKLLKLHGWELLFAERVAAIREKELINLDKDLLYRSIMIFLANISSIIVTVVTFGLYSYMETERLVPSQVFAGLALFNKLTVPLFIFPITMPVVIDALVSAGRVRDFLLLPEAASLPKVDPWEAFEEKEDENHLKVPKRQVENSTDSVFLENIKEDEEEEEESERPKDPVDVVDCSSDVAVSIINAHFTWDEETNPAGLKNISLQIPKNKLTVVVGAIGSGKSSLVKAILGEMKLVAADVLWTRAISTAYSAQKSWMLNASVRDNILFGKEFKPRRYRKVIEACALQPDVDILPHRDLTEIGDKGINLSGGQKQRIAIARALYSNSSLVILDDPLSALDGLVAHQVFDNGIQKFLLRSKRTVILVTHHLPVLQQADHIIAMEQGSIRIQGSLKEIQEKDEPLYTEWKEIMTKKEAEIQKQIETKTAKERWSLLKLVSKIGLQFKHRTQDEGAWKSDDDTKHQLDQFRMRKGTFSHYKNLSHDIFIPSDECHDELMTPLLRRRAISRTSKESRTSASSSKHPELMRMSSLQAEVKGRSPLISKKVKRLQSLPADEDASQTDAGRPRSGTFDNNQRLRDTILKRLFSKKIGASTSSSSVELETVAVQEPRLTSTVSGVSDLNEEEEEENLLSNHNRNREEREYGRIPMRVYLSYISTCGYFVSVLYLFFAIGYEVIRVYTNFWLSDWSNAVSHIEAGAENESKYEETMSFYFSFYVLLSLFQVVVSLSSNLIGKKAGANSRQKLYSGMMNSLIRCPMQFFDVTPIGRIINRFTSDVAVVDRKLCISMQRFLQFVSLCISAIVVNAIVNPWFLTVALPLVCIYYVIQRFYRFSSRELQRIEAISRGPIYSHFHETLEGLSTIRAFKEEKRFTLQMLSKIDQNNRAALFINVGNRWLSISLDYLGSVIVFFATLASMISCWLYPEVVTPSMVGLAINYTLLVPVYLNWVVKFLAEVEMFMNSVERIDRYSDLERENYGDERADLSGWPAEGEISFENVSVGYGTERKIISDLNVEIGSKKKVGICGRTGSGKSSLLMALFRISQVSEGRILIDKKDIAGLPLLKLRSSISIIPQENILFTGSLRFNLDPHNKIPDFQIWKALESCQMKDIVTKLPGNLDSEIKDGGSEFSAGQKQLLGLARAILHKSKLVILDEASSFCDFKTERTLLQVVKEEFKDSTVLTIAHRLDTLLDGDTVMVLKDGKLAEIGNPTTLMRKSSSLFAKMIKEANEENQLSTN